VIHTAAADRATSPAHGGLAGSHAPRVTQDDTPVGRLLDRLVRQERENVRLVAAWVGKPRFEEVFELYRASGFLYPAKLAALQGDMPSIEQTWRRALAPDARMFRVVARYGTVDDAVRLRNTISAFAYAPGTWQGQHLVSRERHEFTGTLAVLIELVEGLHDEGVEHIRLSFRPDNPGTRMLFGEVPRWIASNYHSLALCDYGCVPLERLRLAVTDPADITVKPVGHEGAAAVDFYRRILHPVELASLALHDPELRQLDAGYRAAGLERRRKVLLARDHGEIVGACLVHDSAVGLNFSFLENAVEHLRVRPDLSPSRRWEVWTALASAAIAHTRSGRDPVVTVDPADRDLSVPSGMIAADHPRQYAVLTVSRDGASYLRSIDCFIEYYRRLLAAEAAR
jgi:hypothetical protein